MMDEDTKWSTNAPIPGGDRGRGLTPNASWSSQRNSSVRRQQRSSSRSRRSELRDSVIRRKRKRHKPLGEKIGDWFRAFLAFLFSNVGIVCLVVGYTIAGAFIFEAIEGSHNRKIGNGYDVPSSRNETALHLWKLTTKENIFSEKLWKSKVDTILKSYQDIVVDAVKNEWDGSDSMENRKWSFAGAFLYSLTVITTIGYGNTCPRTMWGKVITIGYAIAGMPLFLLYLSNIGDILAKSFKWSYARCCLCRCRKRPRESRDRRVTGSRRSLGQSYRKTTCQMVRMQSGRDGAAFDTVSMDNEIDTASKTTTSDQGNDNDDEDEEEDDDDASSEDEDNDEDDNDDNSSDRYDPKRITVPLTLCLSIIVGYICGGAFLFSEWEDWNFLDGSYFCFISLSTIGFGDIVPGDKIYSSDGVFDLSFIFCSMYLMLGMALIAMCFNLMQEEVIAKIRSLTRSVKHVLRCDQQRKTTYWYIVQLLLVARVMMQISASDYYQRAPRSCSGGRRSSQLPTGVSSTAVTSASSNIPNNTDNSFRISTTVKASELWCCCCNCTTARSTKAPGFLACLGVCVLVFGYTLLGAFAFMALEGGFKTEPPPDIVRLSSGSSKPGSGNYGGKTSVNIATRDQTTQSPTILSGEDEETAEVRKLRASTVEKLWSITEDLNVLYRDNWTRLAEREILEFQEKMVQSLNHDPRSSTFSVYGGTIQRSSRGGNDRYKGDKRWTFGGSLLYSLTLITTIGYGSVAPRTIWGRVITVVYALAGIPLMLVYLSTIGDVFARTFRRLYGRLCHRNTDCSKKQPSSGGQFLVSPPPIPGLIEKSYHRYDNHVETTKLGNFYSSKDSSCDELGVRATGGAILLDRDGLESNLYLHSASSANALQDMSTEKRHLHPCSQISLMPSAVGYGTDTICVVRIPISLCLLIILLYVCAGTFIFHRLEGWNLLESSYFCFTSLGTIGFGDLVPTGRSASTKLLEELSLCACSLYILIGMGLIAMCFNLMQEEVVRVVRVFGRTCGTTGGITPGSSLAGATGLKSDLCGDASISIGGNILSDGCRQELEHEDDGIAMSLVSATS
ncbi:uncharacterized protein LOC141534114 [Cotesia typhae]|uniref:uncharacterized protein LOC141534114 n=1 Tax=Cotesia typhae TaxID=2053667 RepID=UPI003D69EE58